MLGYFEYIGQFCNIPIGLIVAVIVFFAISNIIGEILEFKGKIVPEIFKIRKYFARKKQERETLAKIPEMMGSVERLLNDVEKHYNEDNIKMRDEWIENVNGKLGEHDGRMDNIDKKLDKIERITLDTHINNQRGDIISFANRASDLDTKITREEFTRIFNLYESYERIIEENGRTNGEVDVSYGMIREAYEYRTKHHTFVEDTIGYNI